MAPEDRDRNFEKALARHLRSSAPSGAHSNAFGVSPREACPDTEMLAAYYDGSLSPEELGLWKQHVVGCENCQLILAHLETPLEVPLDAAKKEFAAAASQRPAASAASAAPVSVVRPRRPPSMRWLWLVPAGAAAAGLIAWISLHEQKPAPLTQPNTVEEAENRPAIAAPPAESLSAPPPSRVAPPQHIEKERKGKDQPASPPAGGSVGGVVSAPSTARDGSDKQLNNRVQLTQQAPSQYAPNPSHGPSLSQEKQQQQQLMVSPGVVAGASRGAVLDQKKSASPPSSQPQERAKQATAPPPASSEQSFLADETVTPPAPTPPPAPPPPAPASTGAAGTAKTQNVASVPAASETVEIIASAGSSLKMTRSSLLQDPHVFSDPDKKHLWRVGPVGLLEISGNRGGKWKPQVSGVTTDLVAGFATSAKVAWVVGRSGTILRTTDGGILWSKLNSPDPGDLAGVIATDAMNAKIWFAPDEETHVTKTYQTTDGGTTWSIVPN